MTASVELDYESRPARGAPEGALVLLHGRGADEYDLLPLLDELDPDRRLHAITPRGPLSQPPGGAHWYALGGIPTPDPETFGASTATLAAWLNRLPERTGVRWERTVLGGFSQGAVMSYALGLGAGRPSPAGILALSGFIPSVPGFELALEDRTALPVAIGHGSVDPVIPVQLGQQASRLLAEAGLQVTYRESPIGHGVDLRLLAELRPWLVAAIAARTTARAG
ncbi:MAG: phospholipase [Solirubrobacterales bacterium]|nr:MAG: phospholipase [Solirubrobacterales bacterium]